MAMAKTVGPFIPYLPNTNLRVGVSPWSRMHPECLKDWSCDVGFELEIYTFLAVLLNFTVELKYSKDAGCGSKKKDGTWSGLIGMLQRDEIDIIGNLCLVDESRTNETWLDHTWPVLQYRQAFLIRAPDLINSFQLFAPFEPLVWFLLLAVLFVFFIAITFAYYKIYKYKFANAVATACNDVFKITIGLDCAQYKHIWQVLTCFVGYVILMYSTFVTTDVLKPNDRERPFQNYSDLAEALYEGTYKLLDYHSSPRISCYSDDVCQKLKNALKIHGYYQLHSSNVNSENDELLTTLLEHPNFVLVKSRNSLITYLDAFPNRSKLWLLDDEASGEQWFSYFYKKNFSMARLFDKALVLMGDGKENINNWYISLSKQAVRTKKIVQKLSARTRFNLQLTTGVWECYLGCIGVSTIAFIFEQLYHKFFNTRVV